MQVGLVLQMRKGDQKEGVFIHDIIMEGEFYDLILE